MWELLMGTEIKKILCGTYDTEEKAKAEMVRPVTEMGYEPYYWRYCGTAEDYFVDFGSWSSFFFIRKI